ncbi:RNA-binding protein RO60-like isoform X1 [Lutzomyia longipalpis]|uniref:RNA-binding protein RO60-like isoform X1 n=2 Tax=Lutzomyia longipalpis TaxID=7200 RepID=UPI0024833AA2|nr:RNA-binding protein RO60-like isoform X1 [Lutzomyia longipalpis]
MIFLTPVSPILHNERFCLCVCVKFSSVFDNRRIILNHTEVNKMSSMQLLRYLHIGTTGMCYVATEKKPSVRELCRVPDELECLKTLAEGENHRLVTLTIKKAMDSAYLRRSNETIICIAYCLHLVKNKELRDAIHQMLPDLLVTQDDLLLFAFYNKFYSINRTGYGRGLRNAITKWYNLRTTEDLCDMMARRSVINKWSHKDIIRMAHPKIEDPQKVLIVKSTFQGGPNTIENAKCEQNVADMVSYQRLLMIIEFKNLKDGPKAAEMIRKYNIPYAYLPTHLWPHEDVWDALLPSMTYPELLEAIPRLSVMKMLKPTEALSKKYCTALSNMETLRKSQMHPISIYAFLQLYRSKRRYAGTVKEEYYHKKIGMQEIEVNEYVAKKLMNGVNNSFKYLEPIDQSICVVINLRKKLIRRPVFGLKQLTCLDVSLLMALSLFHSGRIVTIMTFSNIRGYLKRIPITTEMSYDEAYKVCTEMTMDKTWQDLGTPLDMAVNEGKHYNTFIIFVDSLLRAGRTGKPPIPSFTRYKTKYQQKSPNSSPRFIVVNMRRRKGDMKFTDDPDSMGMLEIAGFDRNSPKVIEAFMKQQFV